jgi:single-stranded-DNA-specific exonuclease
MITFLYPDESSQSEPLLLRDMGPAVGRLRTAVREGESVAVYGDYDVDGLTATVLLVDTLNRLGGNAIPYIPHRNAEGYGLQCRALDALRAEGVRLILTADCGVGNAAEVAHANGIGLDVVVTDHHEPRAQLPPAVATVNPKRRDSSYPFRELAGVGVAYRLAQALVGELHPPGVRAGVEGYLDLVALGTVADVVPLVDENRTLVKRGLRALNDAPRPGIVALAEAAGLPVGALDEGHIGYGLGPRLNAAGRIDDARIAYDLLTTTSYDDARRYARTLEERNNRRQRLTERGLERARELASRYAPGAALLLVDDPDFAAGVVGLIAAKLAEEYNRPAVVLERGAEYSRGSARSIPGFDIGAALAACVDLLERYGGHATAAGLAVANRNLPALAERLTSLAERDLGGQDLRPRLVIDAEMPLAAVDWDLQRTLSALPPHGLGNPEPIIASRDVVVRECRAVGRDGAHLRLAVQDGEARFTAVGFGLGEWAAAMPRVVDIAYGLAVNEWNGRRRLELRLKDVRESWPS